MPLIKDHTIPRTDATPMYVLEMFNDQTSPNEYVIYVSECSVWGSKTHLESVHCYNATERDYLWDKMIAKYSSVVPEPEKSYKLVWNYCDQSEPGVFPTRKGRAYTEVVESTDPRPAVKMV
jgi:hypothetical protein